MNKVPIQNIRGDAYLARAVNELVDRVNALTALRTAPPLQHDLGPTGLSLWLQDRERTPSPVADAALAPDDLFSLPMMTVAGPPTWTPLEGEHPLQIDQDAVLWWWEGSAWVALNQAKATGEWLFSTSTDTTLDPGAGRLRFDTASQGTVTKLALSRLTNGGVDFTARLAALGAGDTIYIQDKDFSSNYVRFSVTATPTNNTEWFLFPVDATEYGGATPNNNAPLLVQFTSAGGGGGGAGTISIGLEGSAPYLNTGTLEFRLGDGFVLTQPAAGTVRAGIGDASETLPGVVSIAAQLFAGVKQFVSSDLKHGIDPGGLTTQSVLAGSYKSSFNIASTPGATVSYEMQPATTGGTGSGRARFIFYGTTADAGDASYCIVDRSLAVRVGAHGTDGIGNVIVGGIIVTIGTGGGGGGGHVIQDEGTPLAARAALNFVGAGVTATDDSANNRTVVTIPGGGSITVMDTATVDLTLTGTQLSAAVKDASITYAKMQDVSASSRLLGRGDSGPGDVQELTIGLGLLLTGTDLRSAALGCSLTNPSSQTLTHDTWTDLNFNTEIFDSASMHSAGTPARLTIPAGLGGTWLLGGGVAITQSAVGSYRGLRFLINGATSFVHTRTAPAPAGINTFYNISGLLSLNDGDYITLQAIQNSGSTLNSEVSSGAPALWALRMGD